MLFPVSKNVAASRRVVVTGAGIITALGRGWQTNAEGFRLGKPAFRAVQLFEVARQRCKIAAEIDLPDELPETRLKARSHQRLNRAARMLLWAGTEAWGQCGWETGSELPVVLGTTSGEMVLGENYLRQAILAPRSRQRQPTRIVYYQVQRQGLDLCDALGITGSVNIIANACASGANAIGHAWELVRTGRAERALTGGYDALCQLTFAGFDSLQALSPTPCRPFDAARTGLTLGEGAAVLALETWERAQARGAEILGEIIGYGAATDIHHLTQPHPEGDAAWSAMTEACARGGVRPEQVDYINAHGTATPHNDATEAVAINRWADGAVNAMRVSSTKASIGHLLGAAGAVEAVVCLMALRGQWLPPEMSLQTVDPACRFQIVRQPMAGRLEVALSNSFGFGGANASLLFRRWV